MEYINTRVVQVFSKSWCPYCVKAVKLLETYCMKDKCDPRHVEIIELDYYPNGEKMKEDLTLYTQQTTIPYVFLYGKFIGGYSDLAYLHLSNKLIDTFMKKRIEFMNYEPYRCESCGSNHCYETIQKCNCKEYTSPKSLYF